MNMLEKIKSKKGFTLIELIVVIAVIAILAAILLPQFTGFSDGAKQKSALSDARNLSVALEALVAEGKTVDESAMKTYLGNKTFSGTFTTSPTATGFVYTKGITPKNTAVTYTTSTGAFTMTFNSMAVSP